MLLEKLRGEWPGVLSWMLSGCLAWQAEGKLPEPEAVTRATRAYRRAEDQIGRFLDERCEVDETGVPGESELFTPYAELLAAYSAWCRATGETPVEGREFREALDKRGFVSATRRLGRDSFKGRVGIALRSENGSGEEAA